MSLFGRGSSSNNTPSENDVSRASRSVSGGQVFKDKKGVEESEEDCEDILKTPRSLKGQTPPRCANERAPSSRVISPQPDSS